MTAKAGPYSSDVVAWELPPNRGTLKSYLIRESTVEDGQSEIWERVLRNVGERRC
jgi:hypothetical protein